MGAIIRSCTAQLLLRKLEAVKAPITRGGRVARVASQLQREAVYHQTYVRRPDVRRRLCANRWRRFNAAHDAKRQREAMADTRADAQRRLYRKDSWTLHQKQIKKMSRSSSRSTLSHKKNQGHGEKKNYH